MLHTFEPRNFVGSNVRKQVAGASPELDVAMVSNLQFQYLEWFARVGETLPSSAKVHRSTLGQTGVRKLRLLEDLASPEAGSGRY